MTPNEVADRFTDKFPRESGIVQGRRDLRVCRLYRSRMRLLNAKTKELELRHDRPPYAIVSHRWGIEAEEVLFADIHDLPCTQRKTKGYAKLLASCSKAIDDGLSYVWLDTCCIDKRNEKELTAAINSMYDWYHQSVVCYAYLHDVNDISEIPQSEWFLRGWTLQELIAPKELKFFANDWTFLGTREKVISLGLIPQHIRIRHNIFGSHKISQDVCIAQRLCWAASRKTTEEEDMAYSLLGLFDVHLPAIYGIKQKAFQELQLKIMSKFPDKSLFAWKLSSGVAVDYNPPSSVTGLLAASPSQYHDIHAYEIPCPEFYRPFGSHRFARCETFSLKNGAVCVTLPIRQTRDPSVHEALLRCSFDPPPQDQRPLVVYLKQENKYDRFVRIHVPVSLDSLQDDSMTSFTLEKVYVDEVPHTTFLSPVPQTQTLSLPKSAPLNFGSYEHTNGMGQPEQIANGKNSSSILPLLPSDSESGIAPTAEGLQNGLPSVDAIRSSMHGAMSATDTVDHEDWITVPPPQCFPFRHPPGTKTVNVIVCGEPGAGSGGVVNLIAGREIVVSMTEFRRPPMTFTIHDISFDSRNIRIFHAIGPRDHLLDVEGYHTAIKNVTKLTRSVCDNGGVHLLLCCVLRTKLNWNIHRLFYGALCSRNVPVVVLVTGFAGIAEHLPDLPTDIHYDVCTSISVARPHTPEKDDCYTRSAQTVRKLLVGNILGEGSKPAYLLSIGPSTYLVLKEFMSASAKRTLTLQLFAEWMRSSGSKVARMNVAAIMKEN